MIQFKTLKWTLFLLFILSWQTNSLYNTTECTATQFFDTRTLNCGECPSGAASADESRNSCVCQDNDSFQQIDLIGSNIACTTCATGFFPSPDKRECVGFDINNCVNEQIMVETSGAWSCQACDDDAYPNELRSACIQCGVGMTRNPTFDGCICKAPADYLLGDDTCVIRTTIPSSLTETSLNQIAFFDMETSGGSTDAQTSDTLSFIAMKAWVGCVRDNDPQQCQVAANVCTMQLYDTTNQICNRFFLTTSSSAEGAIANPRLYFTTPETLINNANIQTIVTLGKGSTDEISELNFFVASYSIDGTYLGISPLSNQLLLCPNSVAISDTIRTFGTPYISACLLDLSEFLQEDTVFHELYFLDSDGSYLEIPIKAVNYRSGTTEPNQQDGVSSSTVFTKRFTILDTASGISSTNGYVNGDTPTTVRFAKTMNFVVGVDDNDSKRIKRPYLEITYASRDVASFETNSTTWISFRTEFKMDIGSFWKTCTILFVIANIIVGVVAVFQTYVWSRYNPMRFNPDNWLLVILARFIIILAKCWSEAMFFFLFIMSGYWFVFYKMQNTVYFLVPDPDLSSNEYMPFFAVFIIMVIMQILVNLNMIREQSQMDFFFIDWEKPRLTFNREVNREVYFQSAWRMILVGNEFNELQVERHFKVELLYFLFGFFLVGLKWENFQAIVPNMTTSVMDGTPTSHILKFFITLFVLFVISLILYLLRKIIVLRFPTPIQNFTDLCSIANISVMIFDKEFHGYYLHGMSPSGSSEGSIGELKRALELEGKGTVRGRGLLANDPTNLQTFEIFFPIEFRQTYNNLYKAEIVNELYARQAAQKMSNQVNLKIVNKAMPDDFDYAKLEGKRTMIQNHLKLYIEGVRVESSKLIREKTPSMRFFGIPPVDYEVFQGNPIFFRDNNFGFQNTVFYGNEFRLILLDIIFYLMWDAIFRNTLAAILAAYISNKVFAWLRQFFGERNIAQKALIDDAFLI